MLFDEIEGAEIVPMEEIEWRLQGLPKIFYEWCREAHLSTPIAYELSYDAHTITVYTNRPGILIGLRGATIDKYQKILQEARYGCYKDWTFVLKEIKGDFANYIVPGKKKKKKVLKFTKSHK